MTKDTVPASVVPAIKKRTKPAALKGGSRKGIPNKVTAALKDMILGALDKAGGESYLLERANDPKTQTAFLALIGKVLPVTLAGDSSSPLVVQIVRFGDAGNKTAE